MTIGELKQKIKNIPDNAEIRISDYSNSEILNMDLAIQDIRVVRQSNDSKVVYLETFNDFEGWDC